MKKDAKDILIGKVNEPKYNDFNTIDLPFDYWVKLNSYKSGLEYWFSLTTKHGDVEIKSYKNFNYGLIKVCNFLNKFNN